MRPLTRSRSPSWGAYAAALSPAGGESAFTRARRISVPRDVDCRLRAAVWRTLVRVLRRPQHAQRAAGAVVNCVATAVRCVSTTRTSAPAWHSPQLHAPASCVNFLVTMMLTRRPSTSARRTGRPLWECTPAGGRVLAGEAPTPSHGRAAPPHPAHPPAAATLRAAPRTGERARRRCSTKRPTQPSAAGAAARPRRAGTHAAGHATRRAATGCGGGGRVAGSFRAESQRLSAAALRVCTTISTMLLRAARTAERSALPQLFTLLRGFRSARRSRRRGRTLHAGAA